MKEVAEKQEKQKKSGIGKRVFGTLLAMAAVYVITVLCDISALGKIGDLNASLGNTYVKIVETEGNLAETVKDIELYANLTFIVGDDASREAMVMLLDISINRINEMMGSMTELADQSGNEALVNAWAEWEKPLQEFYKYSKQILETAQSGDMDTLQVTLGDFQAYAEAVQTGEDAYSEVMD